VTDPYARFEGAGAPSRDGAASQDPNAGLPPSIADAPPVADLLRWPSYVVGAGLTAYGVMVVVGLVSGAFEVIDALPLVPLLAWAAYRLAGRLARIDDDPKTAQVVIAGFWAHMMGAVVRAGVVAWFYGNRSDALDYHLWGKAYAQQFRSLDFSHVVGMTGTDFMRTLTGIVYSFTGASKVSGAVLMSFLAYLGLLLLWRAFKRAVPTGAVMRYGLLVLFLPSLLYWPSALGKEGWAIFCIGVASYGVALVMSGRIPLGIVLVVAGLGGVAPMRPHVALVAFCGIALAGVVGKSRRPGGKASLLRLFLFGALLIGGIVLASSTADFFGVPSLNQETVNATLANAEGRTGEAGSAFTPVSMSNPANAPLALATVLFRPFPFEVSNAIAAASALEGVFLIVITWRSRSRLRSLLRCMRRDPYAAYAFGILVTFVYAFSAFSNFGILARQRCQVLPFFLVLVCLPVWKREGVISTEAAVAGRDEHALPQRDEQSPDPYADSRSPSSDPYAGIQSANDPYRKFPT